MNRFARARALVDALSAERARLEMLDGRLEVVGSVSEALRARLLSFCGPEDPAAASTEAQAAIARSMGGATAQDRSDLGPLDETLERVRREGPHYRALAAVARAPSRAARELLTLPVSYAVGLSVPFTVTFRRRATECVATTSRTDYAAATQRGAVAFVLRELEAAARAVEVGRAHPSDLDRWLELKGCGGSWILTPELAGSLDVPSAAPSRGGGLCFGELFDALGAELVDVTLPDASPAAATSSPTTPPSPIPPSPAEDAP